jgi:hypothetical protein
MDLKRSPANIKLRYEKSKIFEDGFCVSDSLAL